MPKENELIKARKRLCRRVLRAVCEYLGVLQGEVKGAGGGRAATRARELYCYTISRLPTPISLGIAAEIVGLSETMTRKHVKYASTLMKRKKDIYFRRQYEDFISIQEIDQVTDEN